MSGKQAWRAKDASGEEYEYRRVCSVIERRRITSSVWFRVGDMAYMTPTELRLIADLIESKEMKP